MKPELLEEINCATYADNSEEIEGLFEKGMEKDGGENWYLAQNVIEKLHVNGYMLIKVNNDNHANTI